MSGVIKDGGKPGSKDGCGDGCAVPFDGQNPAYRRALLAVIGLNGGMFVLEATSGLLAGSMALQADALDFAADTATYAISLWAIGRAPKIRAGVAMAKGASLFFMGLWVLGTTVYHVLGPVVPRADIMGGVALLALAVNLGSVFLLLPHAQGEANVRSVWLCSRNDAIGNVAVLLAAGAVVMFHSPWPDLVVAALMAALFLRSAWQILKQARGEWGEAEASH